MYGLSSSTGSYGVVGTSPYGGVWGSTSGSSGVGVLGKGAAGYGGYFTTTSGVGVSALADSGTGLYAESDSGNGAEIVADGSADGMGVYSSGGIGLRATSGGSYGILANTNSGIGVYGKTASGNGADFSGTYIGVVARAPAGSGFPLVATDSSGNNLAYVDGAGNFYYHGSLHTFARMSNGANATAFSSKTTAPTIEDTGTAELAGGVATVRFDPTFAAAIDRAGSYRVFVTPDGDTPHGLFVAQKTSQGFVVREAQGGRSTVSFDYRIVASELGQSAQHMAATGLSTASAGPRAALPIVPAATMHRLPTLRVPAAPTDR